MRTNQFKSFENMMDEEIKEVLKVCEDSEEEEIPKFYSYIE